MIVPTLGRVAWFTPSRHEAMPTEQDGRCAALVVKVWNERMVNLAVFDANGNHHPKTSVALLQNGDVSPEDGYFCEWMPYQLGQAAKTQSYEKQLGGSPAS